MVGEGTIPPNPGHRASGMGTVAQITRAGLSVQDKGGQWAGLVNGKGWLNRPPGRALKRPAPLHGAKVSDRL